ncbi:GH92 family glycosyl hydrolase [Phyllobacterium zundukense]|uniref:GH92 family glycosyl hydrolase n=1 Tax=Phyllobacterium zundukense TaxID=1867719 RepID=A0ACD4D4Q4_9HYPH|nr:GH92 family glycosyl hydrolase [Phyllobacterium zundukense]UXN60724.1 GH92 family glycosyl hydrolase [Phyllobacterium zundukense]
MTIKKTLLATLLGCTMLASCNGDDGKKNDTANLQSTFDQTVRELNGQIDQLKQRIAGQAAIESVTVTEVPDVSEDEQATPPENVKKIPADGKVAQVTGRGDDKDLVPLVNPMVGTAGTTNAHSEDKGQTYPAVGVPFGMTQWTPATNSTETKGTAPYYYGDASIKGFRSSHFLSGSAVQEYGSIQLFAGQDAKEQWTPNLLSSKFSHEKEKAGPDLYEVELPERNIAVSMTGTARCGLIRFRFLKGGTGWISVQNNNDRQIPAGLTTLWNGAGRTTIEAETQEVVGNNKVGRFYAGMHKPAGFFGQFAVTFDRKFRTGGIWIGKTFVPDSKQAAAGTAPSGAVVMFDDLKAGEAVTARACMSFADVNGARANGAAELPDFDFDKVQKASRAAWNRVLNTILVDGTETDRCIFYTSLYHMYLAPRMFSDVSGKYPRFGGGASYEAARGFTYYDDYSMWDTFRALHPFLTITEPKRVTDLVRSLLIKGEQGGFLPIFPLWNSYTSAMIGDHAISMIGDAHLKGIRGFDVDKAYALMVKNATQIAGKAEYEDGKGRRALGNYLKFGYIPLEDGVPDAFHQNEQVSRTLEYAYDDFVLAEVAKSLGEKTDEATFRQRAQNYRNVIDPATGFARGRYENGTWFRDAKLDAQCIQAESFCPGRHVGYITEGSPFQYTFYVPQDIPGLISLQKDREAGFLSKLDALFAGKGKGYYWHGNEPSHHIAYLFNYAGAAAKTQKHVEEQRRTQYLDAPDGLFGNDDAGQMSAWYAFSALGFYPVTPGVPAYVIGTPLFSSAKLQLENGKTFEVIAERPAGTTAKDTPYIASAMLNGKPLQRYWIRHSEITAGGTLTFKMSPIPSINWPQDETPPGQEPTGPQIVQ